MHPFTPEHPRPSDRDHRTERPDRRGFLAAGGTALGGLVLGAGVRSARAAGDGPVPVGAASARGGDTSLGGFDAVALAELIRRGELTPPELLDDVRRRAERVNPALNAIIPALFDVEHAVERAARPAGDGVLAGVPILLKNLTDYEHARIDYGCRLFVEARARGVATVAATSAITRAIVRAGMIVAGVTNVPELGLIDSTEPVLRGPTLNPWNATMSPGGSSGGAAAAVAAGIVPLAHASDGGGSIRIPASHCGLVGLKPTRGREAGSGIDLARDVDIMSEGCVSRTVRDTAAFLSVIERRGGEFEPVGFVGPEGRMPRLRIAVMPRTLGAKDPEPAVATALRSAADLCAEFGHAVEDATLPIDGEVLGDAFLGLWASMAQGFLPVVPALLGPGAKPEDWLEPWTLGLAAMSRERGAAANMQRALQVFRDASEAMRGFFESVDVLLTPVQRVPPFPTGHHDPTGDFETIFARLYDEATDTPLQNAVGMPGISLPLHWTGGGLPVGVQASAWRGGEAILLRLAYQLEEARPWAGRRPPIFAG